MPKHLSSEYFEHFLSTPNRAVQIFKVPGVNPQCMNPNITGDACFFQKSGGENLAFMADGVWTPAYNMPSTSAAWSSNTLAGLMAQAFRKAPEKSLFGLIDEARKEYKKRLKQEANASLNPDFSMPAKYSQLLYHQEAGYRLYPQCAFAVAQWREDGALSVINASDCMVIAQMEDGSFEELSVDQTERIWTGTRGESIRPESCGRYIHHAKERHAPPFFEEAHFLLDSLCFLNNALHFTDTPNGRTVMTGHDVMMNYLERRTLTVEQTACIAHLWLLSDGAVIPGINAQLSVNYMHTFGIDACYNEAREYYTCHHLERIPCDFSVMRIDMKGAASL